MTIRMRSLKAGLPIGGRRMKLGQEFDVPGETQKRWLVAIKSAEVVPAAVAVVPPAPAAAAEMPKRTYTRKEVVAETPADPPAEPAESKLKTTTRKYARRDMTA